MTDLLSVLLTKKDLLIYILRDIKETMAAEPKQKNSINIFKMMAMLL